MERIVAMERRLLEATQPTWELLWEAKRLGFSDRQIAAFGIAEGLPERVRALRQSMGIRPVYKMVDTCAAEFEAVTPYYYSTYEEENEALPLPGKRAIVIGSGPIRIGQGIEFDYCSVHAAWALQEEGIQSIMINSNPETVSTDFDTSQRLYFEPLDEEERPRRHRKRGWRGWQPASIRGPVRWADSHQSLAVAGPIGASHSSAPPRRP